LRALQQRPCCSQSRKALECLNGSALRILRALRPQSSSSIQSLRDEEGSGQPEHLAATSAAAVRYRSELGLGVLPVVNKKPRIKGWQNGGLRADASIVKVFDRMPEEAFVGVPTGYPLAAGGFLYVLDVDLDKPGVEEALGALPELPETVTARTPNGWHYWFKTATPLPGQFREGGLELKGAGQYVVVPPAPNRSWLRDPWEFEIADCPDFLRPQPIQRASAPLHLRVDPTTGEVALDLSDPLSELRRAKTGTRRQTLLRVAGRLAYRARQGLLNEKQTRRELLETALQVGIEESEALRLIEFCFTRNQLKVEQLLRGEPGSASNTSCHTTKRDLEVLSAISRVYLERIGQSGIPFEGQAADVFSLRYLMSLTGIEHPQQVSRSLDRLISARLLWRSPKPKRLKAGQRPCNQFRPTYLGMSLAEQSR
jgi:hypothetical protein